MISLFADLAMTNIVIFFKIVIFLLFYFINRIQYLITLQERYKLYGDFSGNKYENL